MSKYALILAFAILAATHFLYYPKWAEEETEAIISWDVSGYYMYLPATLIYQDLKKLKFIDEIFEKYTPTPELQQAYIHEPSGNYVMKYSMGQAIIFLPGFIAGHLWASTSSVYPADGYSFPYQFMISMWVLIISFLGLIALRKVLLASSSELATGLTLLGIVLGSNYLNYAAIDGAMTHNTLFTVYAFLLLATVNFYRKPSIRSALAIGSLVGLAALTRPTELISALIPVLWGLNLFGGEEISRRFKFFLKNYQLLLLAGITAGIIGFLQLAYWKFITGEWIVYSYREQGFSWLNPHVRDGLLSYKSGWLTYSPFMIFTLLGFFPLFRKNRRIFFVTLIFSCLFMYICFAWDEWWYGASLGQRSMIQCYPVLAIPLAAFFDWLLKRGLALKLFIGAFMVLFFYINVWFTHQAHLGGILHAGQMRKAYYWKTLLTWKQDPENLKLLDDVNVIYQGPREGTKVVFQDSSSVFSLDTKVSESKEVKVPLSFTDDYDWIRVLADFQIWDKEWFFWTMTHFEVEVYHAEDRVGFHMIRVQRLLDQNETKTLHIDIERPTEPVTELRVTFRNANGGYKSIRITNLRVETFSEG